ncbi:MAG: alpha/beta hydrolase [Oscillospiraceae bacterium]
MEKESMKIWPADESVSLTKIVSGAAPEAPAVLVLPGGGYRICAQPEADPAAEGFAALGYHAYVLRYSTHTGGFNSHVLFPEPLRETAAAVLRIREELGPVPVIPLGFSAGGHLAACYCARWNDPAVYAGLTDDPEALRPAACVLGYGATAFSGNGLLTQKVLGDKDEYTAEEILACAPTEQVGKQNPPTFLFHSVTDPVVPVQSSVDYAAALDRAGVAYELHLFGSGGHAYGLGEGTAPGAWVALADAFLRGVLSAPADYDKAAVGEDFARRHSWAAR